MKDAAWRLAHTLLQGLDPERAHNLTLAGLALFPRVRQHADDPRLQVEAFGLSFANCLGLAAGFDKNGVVAHKAGALGFGFTEIGTLTPRPQAGNPRPRLFRLPEHGGVINRFGFNNRGHDDALATLRKGDAVLGVNIGANKDSPDRAADYAAGIRAFAAVADYFTINVSSPNTPGLRNLQRPDALDDLLARVLDARDLATHHPPILVKIAPDLTLGELDDVVRIVRHRGADGMIVSNTTIARPDDVAAHRHGGETGGLSGRPLFHLSTRRLAQASVRVEGQFPLVGVGGVDSADAAFAKIEAGATLVQLYSALVFHGPGLIDEIKSGLLTKIGQHGTLRSCVGRRAADWAGAAAAEI